MALPILSEKARTVFHGKTGNVLDVLAGSVILGSIVEWLPPTAAFFGLIYTLIRTYETDTVQKLLRRFRKDKTNEE